MLKLLIPFLSILFCLNNVIYHSDNNITYHSNNNDINQVITNFEENNIIIIYRYDTVNINNIPIKFLKSLMSIRHKKRTNEYYINVIHYSLPNMPNCYNFNLNNNKLSKKTKFHILRNQEYQNIQNFIPSCNILE